MGYSAYIFIVISFLLVSTFQSLANFSIRSRTLQGITYLHLEDVVKYFGFSVECNDKNIYLSNDQNQMVLPVGKRNAYLNSIVSQLSFAPKLNRQSYFVSEQDFLLLMNPLLRSDSLPRHAINRIILDPGHGGQDHGAVGTKFTEKNINLLLAKALKSVLETNGYAVRLTRADDTFISLTKRGEIANEWKADLFISIHCNAAPNKNVTGIETYLVTPKGSPSTYNTTLQQKEVPGNAFDPLNARLAYEIQKNLLRLTDAGDRGIKYYRWQVLREASCPAVLIETGFLSNIKEELKLADNEYQKRLVIGMANGIIEFHNALVSN